MSQCHINQRAGASSTFPGYFFKSVVLLLLFLSSANTRADEFRAFWVDAFGDGFRSQSQVDTLLGVPGVTNSLGTLRNANCNAVIVQVRRRADVCYPSGMGEPYYSGLTPSNFNALEAMIKAAHDTTGGKKRVEVHCWIVAFKTNKGLVYSQHKDTNNWDNYWPTRLSTTNGAENADGAFDPGHPKVLEYLVNVGMDLVSFQTTAGPGGTDGGIDGIHYDYIRFEGSTEGFNPTSVLRYKERHGLSSNPVSTDELFKQWRRDQVSSFVRQMYARIQKTKPSVRQSGSFVTWNPSPTASTRAAFMATRPYYDVYSDWDSWMQEGIVDMAVPMTYYNWAQYPNDYTRWMNFEKDRKANRHMIVGPGTYLNSLTNAISEIHMTRNPSPAGNYAEGFSGYSYRVPYNGGTWANFNVPFKASVTPTWADVPELPWKTAPTNGHLMGTVTINSTNGPWADHATVTLNGPVSRNMYVDGTGFYAFIDLPPGNYNVLASKAGYDPATGAVSVAVGEVTGNMYELNLVVVSNALPIFITQPKSTNVYIGANTSFSALASGVELLYYQWFFENAPLLDQTNTTLSLTNVATNQIGGYFAIVTNAFGAATSQVAQLNILPPWETGALEVLWELPPGARDYLTVSELPYERGMAYNPARHHVLVASRTKDIYVLNAENGHDLHQMDMTGVSGGTYSLLLIGSSDDGVIFAGNLATSSAQDFKLYRWANDDSNTVATVAYSGDPIAGSNHRWGDTLSVRGEGTNTQILVAPRYGTNAVLFTTEDGFAFTPQTLTMEDVPDGNVHLGLTFGTSNTFWGTTHTNPLRRVEYDRAGFCFTTRLYDPAEIPTAVCPIGMSPTLNMVAGVHVASPNYLGVWDLTPTNGTPVLIGSVKFQTDNANMHTGAGAVAFGGTNMVYALDANNGLIAVRIGPYTNIVTYPLTFTQATILPPEYHVWLQGTGTPGNYELQWTSSFDEEWTTLGPVIIGNDGLFEFFDTKPATTGQRFYRMNKVE
jgi:uncharacterized lipoprotein YddW (UPF0748 family)